MQEYKRIHIRVSENFSLRIVRMKLIKKCHPWLEHCEYIIWEMWERVAAREHVSTPSSEGVKIVCVFIVFIEGK